MVLAPCRLSLQGWIRQAFDSPEGIDNLAMSVCTRQPPFAKYVDRENAKSREYDPTLKNLWYIR